MDRDAARRALMKLAKQTAATWQHLRGDAFLGEATIETGNTLYRFTDGVFAGRARKPAPGHAPAWESPPNMQGVELVGFLAREDGLWSLSARWRSGALIVITTHEKAFTLTSPTLAFTIDPPQRPVRARHVRSDGFVAPLSAPPTVRRPAPLSMTRIRPASTS